MAYHIPSHPRLRALFSMSLDSLNREPLQARAQFEKVQNSIHFEFRNDTPAICRRFRDSGLATMPLTTVKTMAYHIPSHPRLKALFSMSLDSLNREPLQPAQQFENAQTLSNPNFERLEKIPTW